MMKAKEKAIEVFEKLQKFVNGDCNALAIIVSVQEVDQLWAAGTAHCSFEKRILILAEQMAIIQKGSNNQIKLDYLITQIYKNLKENRYNKEMTKLTSPAIYPDFSEASIIIELKLQLANWDIGEINQAEQYYRKLAKIMYIVLLDYDTKLSYVDSLELFNDIILNNLRDILIHHINDNVLEPIEGYQQSFLTLLDELKEVNIAINEEILFHVLNSPNVIKTLVDLLRQPLVDSIFNFEKFCSIQKKFNQLYKDTTHLRYFIKIFSSLLSANLLTEENLNKVLSCERPLWLLLKILDTQYLDQLQLDMTPPRPKSLTETCFSFFVDKNLAKLDLSILPMDLQDKLVSL